MNKNQTAREIIEAQDRYISILIDEINSLVGRVIAALKAKLDHDHLPDVGKMVATGPTLSGEDLICPATNKPCEEKLCMMPDDKCEKLAEPIEEDLKKRMETSKHTFGAMCSELPASFYKYHSGEKEFQEIQLKGLGIPDQSFFEQRINTVIAMAWEREVLRKQNDGLRDVNERLKEEVKAWSISLQSLTPGGSEFMDDPHRCVQVARNIHNSQHKFIVEQARQIRELKEQNAGLRDENQTISDVNKEAMNRVRELEARPTLSDDELKKKAEEVAIKNIGDSVWAYGFYKGYKRAVIAAMIEMYKL